MANNGRKIADWERAIEHRSDIEFDCINIKNGYVVSAIGTIQQPSKRRVRGCIVMKTRRVRWNQFGTCTSIYGQTNNDLTGYNINF